MNVSDTLTSERLIALLDLRPLPLEGGYYRETYRAPEHIPSGTLPLRYRRDKAVATAIYYLLTPTTCSALHRLPTDEIFHFYLGDPVQMLHLRPDGSGEVFELGNDLLAGQHLQLVVPRDTWQGSLLKPGGRFALMGTTMAPGFDFEDYEPGERAELMKQYPAFGDLIQRLTGRTSGEPGR